MNKALVLMVTGVLVSGVTAMAAPASFDDGYFKITSTTLQEIDEQVDTSTLPESATDFNACINEDVPGAGSGVDIDQIINYGKMLWKFIEDNKPVVNVKTNTASALPKGIATPFQLEGWNRPVVRSYQLNFKNAYGMSVVDFTFRVAYTWGGSYQGKGKYLSNVTMIPATISVAWGYTFNANVDIANIVNVGKAGAPVAGVDLQMHYSIDTLIKHFEETYAFFVQGDGQFFDQNQ